MQTDKRLDKIEQITIPWDTFKKALTRNYLDPDYEYQRQDRSFVLRLYPPFEAKMEVEYYESKQGCHYHSDWNEKPVHLKPELLILEGDEGGFHSIVNYPTESSVRNALSEEEIEEENVIEESLKIGREMFWDELKTVLPDSCNLGHALSTAHNQYTVDIVWTGLND